MVFGVTRRWRRSARGNRRMRAAKTARSAQSMRGRGLVRRRTATSCRNTRSSTSSVEDVRPISRTSPSTCQKIRYSDRSDTAAIMPNRRLPLVSAPAPSSGIPQGAGEPVPRPTIFLRLPGYQAGCGTSRALSSSAATASRSCWRVSTCPAVSRSCSRVRAVRTASRNVRARVRPVSSGAVASRAVSRSSIADTWLDPTVQPPAAWSSDSARRSSGTRTRANHPTSPSAASRSARHARRRRARSRSGTATATATMTAASSHHNHPVASLVSAADPGAGGDGVGDGVGAASADSVEGRFGVRFSRCDGLGRRLRACH